MVALFNLFRSNQLLIRAIKSEDFLTHTVTWGTYREIDLNDSFKWA